jgi:hypothetical protein
LHHHLRDRHAQTWDSFSIYLTIGDQHLRELESLLLRIIRPRPIGNLQKGKFASAEDLKKIFKKDIVKAQSIELERLLGQEHPHERRGKGRDMAPLPKGRKPTLAPFINRRIHIRFRYKGQLYIAHVRSGGSIKFARESAEYQRLKGKVFTSPSLAASAITKRPMNGWFSWQFERAPGDWVLLNELRK